MPHSGPQLLGRQGGVMARSQWIWVRVLTVRAHPVSLSSLFCHFELWASHLQILRGCVTCFGASRHGWNSSVWRIPITKVSQKLTFPVGDQGEAWGLALPIRCTSTSAVQVQTCGIHFLGRMVVEGKPQGRVPASLAWCWWGELWGLCLAATVIKSLQEQYDAV